MDNDNISTFSTLLGKCIFNHTPFSKARRLKKEGKVSLYQNWRNSSLEEPSAQAADEVDLLDMLVKESPPISMVMIRPSRAPLRPLMEIMVLSNVLVNQREETT